MAMAMARRPVNPSRRVSENGAPPFASSLWSRSRSHPCLLLALILGGFLLIIGYICGDQGTSGVSKSLTWVEGDFSCTLEVQHTIPILKTAYGDTMHRVSHVGPDSCSVVSPAPPRVARWNSSSTYNFKGALPSCNTNQKTGRIHQTNAFHTHFQRTIEPYQVYVHQFKPQILTDGSTTSS